MTAYRPDQGPADLSAKADVFADFSQGMRGDKNGHSGLVDSGVETRFWQKVDRRGPDECWPWLAAKGYQGYGEFGKKGKAHRFAYELLRGPIPEGLHIDHLCENKSCVNPAHLEPVTPLENVRRGSAWREAGRKNAAKTHCPAGHAYTEDNIRWNKGRRDCRQCQRIGRATKRSPDRCPAGHPFTPENTRLERGRVRRCRECRRQLDAQRRHVAMFAAVKALAEERHHSLPPAADPRAASPDAVPQLPPAGLTPE